MRAVSLVPSWTETLIEAGVDVVGRTRFCIHPRAKVGPIPVIGGPRDPDWTPIAALRPHLVVADCEENPPEALAGANAPLFVSHVRNIVSLIADLERLADRIDDAGGPGSGIIEFAGRWRQARERAGKPGIVELPGALNWIRAPEQEISRILYLVWKDPWIAASRQTFIGSMFNAFGFGDRFCRFDTSYAHIDIEAFDDASVLLVFASEPYPFDDPSETSIVRAMSNPAVLVDGEKYCWYGLRSLTFLEGFDRAQT